MAAHSPPIDDLSGKTYAEIVDTVTAGPPRRTVSADVHLSLHHVDTTTLAHLLALKCGVPASLTVGPQQMACEVTAVEFPPA